MKKHNDILAFIGAAVIAFTLFITGAFFVSILVLGYERTLKLLEVGVKWGM